MKKTNEGQADKATAFDVSIKRGRGAPTLPPEEKRTARYMIHMTDEEKEIVVRFAKAHKKTLADFFREAAEEYIARHQK